MDYDLLRRIMRKQAVTQEQLAQSIGIDRTTLCRKLNGLRSFQVWEADQIGRFLCLSPEEMHQIFFPFNCRTIAK